MNEVLACSISKDRLISGSVDGKIYVWNKNSKELLYCLQDLGKQIVSLHCYSGGENKNLELSMEKIEKFVISYITLIKMVANSKHVFYPLLQR